MKFLLVACVAVQLLLCNSKTINDLPHPCRKSDPGVEKCLFKQTELLKHQLLHGIPAFNIPPMDPYQEDEVHIARDFFVASIDAVLRNVKITGLLNYRVDHFKANVDVLHGEVALAYPQITLQTDFEFIAKLLDIPIEFAGSVTVEFINVKIMATADFHTNSKLRVRTFVLDDVNVKAQIGHANAVLAAADPKQQAVADYIGKVLNENERRILELATPLLTAAFKDLVKERVNRVLERIPIETFLIE